MLLSNERVRAKAGGREAPRSNADNNGAEKIQLRANVAYVVKDYIGGHMFQRSLLTCEGRHGFISDTNS